MTEEEGAAAACVVALFCLWFVVGVASWLASWRD